MNAESFTLMETLLTILVIASIIGGFGLWLFKIGKAKGNKDIEDELNKSSISSIQKKVNKLEDRVAALETGNKIDQGSILNEIKKALKGLRQGTERHEN